MIRFDDYVFSAPQRLVEWIPPKCAGICVILAGDPNWAPKPLQPLCFCEFGNNADLRRLARMPNSEALFVSALTMPFSTSAQRSEIRNQLVWGYNPVWQADAGSTLQSELAHKLEELHLILANINRLFEPQIEPKRHRAIGFLPQPAAGLENEPLH